MNEGTQEDGDCERRTREQGRTAGRREPQLNSTRLRDTVTPYLPGVTRVCFPQRAIRGPYSGVEWVHSSCNPPWAAGFRTRLQRCTARAVSPTYPPLSPTPSRPSPQRPSHPTPKFLTQLAFPGHRYGAYALPNTFSAVRARDRPCGRRVRGRLAFGIAHNPSPSPRSLLGFRRRRSPSSGWKSTPAPARQDVYKFSPSRPLRTVSNSLHISTRPPP